MRFKDYLCTEEYSWLDNFIIPNLFRPDKAIIKLAYAALMGPAIGTASGMYHGLRTGNIGEIPRGIGRWMSGLAAGWDSPPAEKLDSTNRKSWWSRSSNKTEESAASLPLQKNQLTSLIKLFSQNPENLQIKNDLNQAVQQFVKELQSLPEEQKKALMIQLSNDMK